MIFEFNILYNLFKTHYFAEFAIAFDIGCILFIRTLFEKNKKLQNELRLKATHDDLIVLKKYITDLFKHEVKNMQAVNKLSLDSVHEKINAINDRITDLYNIVLIQVNNAKVKFD